MQIVQKTNGRSMKRVLLSSALLLVSTLTFAQSKVSGTVKDANGEPLIGVSVMEVGTNNGAVTDMNGNYTLNVKPGAKLKLSYIGFTPQTVKAGSNSQIVLQEDNTALNEVVVVGYGTMRRKDVTSSITTVKAEDLNQGVFTDPGQMLQGKVPGLVVSSTADPNGSPTITLRGASLSVQEPCHLIMLWMESLELIFLLCLQKISSLLTCFVMLRQQPSMVLRLPMV